MRTSVATTAFALTAWLALIDPAAPQAPAPPLGVQEQGAPPPTQQGAPTPENPGLINEMGRLFDKILPLKSPSQTIDDFNAKAKDSMKDAGEALSRVAKPGSMVKGRVGCPVTAGAPDCKFGADRLCQSKGYKEGKSLATDSAEACSAKVLIPGRQRKPDDCHTDTFVTTALCQ